MQKLMFLEELSGNFSSEESRADLRWNNTSARKRKTTTENLRGKQLQHSVQQETLTMVDALADGAWKEHIEKTEQFGNDSRIAQSNPDGYTIPARQDPEFGFAC